MLLHLLLIILLFLFLFFYNIANFEDIKKNKISFVTFGGPSNQFRNRVKEITDQALSMNIFNNIYGFTDINLKNDNIFWDKHKKFIESNKRGYGYWIWKPYILLKVLNEIKENEFILYADSGCYLNISNIEGLNNYINILDNSKYGILSIVFNDPIFFCEKKWNKGDLLNLFENFNLDEIKNTTQNLATYFFVKKNDHSLKFINKWYDLACNYKLIDDSPSLVSNEKEFIEHRHDQSIFSILCKTYGSEKVFEKNDVVMIERDRGNKIEYNESLITIYKNLLE